VYTRRGGMEKTSKGKRGAKIAWRNQEKRGLLCALLGDMFCFWGKELLYSAGVLLYRARLNGLIITYRSLIASHPEKSCPTVFGTRNQEFRNL
jgi:hypothetical protein